MPVTLLLQYGPTRPRLPTRFAGAAGTERLTSPRATRSYAQALRRPPRLLRDDGAGDVARPVGRGTVRSPGACVRPGTVGPPPVGRPRRPRPSAVLRNPGGLRGLGGGPAAAGRRGLWGGPG